jgi:hypothetical protein
MSWQTAECRKMIDRAKQGSVPALGYLRYLLEEIAKGPDVPSTAIIALAECALELGIEQGRKDAEQN